jgi:hypothetical protein
VYERACDLYFGKRCLSAAEISVSQAEGLVAEIHKLA